MKSVTKILPASSYSEWDQFVINHPKGTIFHQTSWLSLINNDIKIIAVYEEEKLKAGVALIKTKKNGLDGYHIPPYTQYFGPLYFDDKKKSLSDEHESIRVILEELKDANHIDFKLSNGHQSILPYHWKGFESSVGITHTVNGAIETYLKNLNKNKLRELKKLQALVASGDIIIEEKISENELKQLLNKTSERKGFDAKNSLVIKLVSEAPGSIAKKFTIRSKGHGVLAFGFFPYDDKTVYNLVNASTRITDPVLKTVNLLLVYQAIEFALKSGRSFDFEGSMLPGVEAFCRLMGGEQVPVYRVQKSSSFRYSLLRAANQIKNDRKKT